MTTASMNMNPEAFTEEYDEEMQAREYDEKIAEIMSTFGFSYEEAEEFYSAEKFERPIEETLAFFGCTDEPTAQEDAEETYLKMCDDYR